MKILGFTGKKFSGKSSAAKYVLGEIMLYRDVLDNVSSFSQNSDGELLFTMSDEDRTVVGPLDLSPINRENQNWFRTALWPIARIYSFAEELKLIISSVYGIDERLLFGTEEDKNTKTHLKWEDFQFAFHPKIIKTLKSEKKLKGDWVRDQPQEFMTIRDLLQVFGTDVCRKSDPDCWVRATHKLMVSYGSEYCIFDDVRFENEAKFIKEKGGLIIECSGGKAADPHLSEKGISSKYVDFSINKDENTLDEKNGKISDFLNTKQFYNRLV